MQEAPIGCPIGAVSTQRPPATSHLRVPQSESLEQRAKQATSAGFSELRMQISSRRLWHLMAPAASSPAMHRSEQTPVVAVKRRQMPPKSAHSLPASVQVRVHTPFGQPPGVAGSGLSVTLEQVRPPPQSPDASLGPGPPFESSPPQPKPWIAYAPKSINPTVVHRCLDIGSLL